MSDLIQKCMTKALIAEGDQRNHGPRWALARRGTLKLFSDHLECGDWRVNYSDFKSARLFSFRSTIGIPGYILTVETENKTYHFGLNGWGAFWKGELPFEVQREQGKLQHNWLSLAAVMAFLAYVAFLIWDWITNG